MFDNTTTTAASFGPSSSSDAFTSSENGISNKRKRRPAGTPDPDAEVVSLSPKTLLESDRYVCEICNQGFQRDQNLQMHRRRHKVPWKLLKRESPEVRKRVFVCPEPSCLHHDPTHALGDLVGIKKHFRRKHSNNKQWVCEKCAKGYAVQSDYKAHLKTCGTRGHSCDCGRVFSRVESFIEHQDACNVRRVRPEVLQALQPVCSSRSASSTSPSSDNNFGTVPLQRISVPPNTSEAMFLGPERYSCSSTNDHHHNLELQLLPSSNHVSRSCDQNHATNLKLSIGSPNQEAQAAMEASRVKEGASEQLKLAMAEKAYAEEARRQAKKQIELAELEFANAKRIRQQAQAEVEKAQVLKEQASKKISSTILQITCHSCKQQFQATTGVTAAAPVDEISLAAASYMSSAITEGEG
ncbi:zinc finger protein SHOOT GRAVITROPISM 5 isoform X2 [Rhododendron vialii]|uniref:zinc finger protein SHOOT GRAVITROPISM 5 isoform X2 n=1 Tax=Rhododendron vialii TaxID=182163 RepID=UPI0026602C69|nr:zinc finger protein SHOOT GRAVITROPISM 5 isoform X2 [Rhododendron vialii]